MDAATYERFLSHTKQDGDCLIWTASRQSGGYGQFWVGNTLWTVHRLAWTHHHGPIPPGLQVRHTCDRRVCVADEHLLLGTHADNMRDMAERGRAPGWTYRRSWA